MGLEAYTGDGWLVSQLNHLINWGRKNSLWPIPYGTACCGIEMMATMASGFDIARFGAERPSFSPRQADVMIVAGTIVKKMAPVIHKIYLQMAEPKWVLAMGACACSGGIFDTYSTLQGIDQVIPVDVFIPGCPPRPEGLLYGLLELQKKIEKERPLSANNELKVG